MDSTGISADIHLLGGNADSAEFCPIPGYHQALACGTYTLQEGDRPTRLGELHLFHVASDGQRMREAQRLKTSGIFDLKWSSRGTGGTPRLAQASADGSVSLYTLLPGTGPLTRSVESGDGGSARAADVSLTEGNMEGEDYEGSSFREQPSGHGNSGPRAASSDPPCGIPATEAFSRSSSSAADTISGDPPYFLREAERVECGDAMCVSLDWDPFGSSIAVSRSDGSVCTIKLDQSGGEVDQAWSAHGYEAWTTAYDRWSPQVLYSGADDCNFCAWDLREDLSRPIFRDRTSHAMGVCCIQSSPLREHLLCTGSYDEVVRLWDRRNHARPITSHQVLVGGGVWRLKWHPRDAGLLLAACMHNGFVILRVEEGAQDTDRWHAPGCVGNGSPLKDEREGGDAAESQRATEVVEEYKGHKSLAYGADWYHGRLTRHKGSVEDGQGILQMNDSDTGSVPLVSDAHDQSLFPRSQPMAAAQRMNAQEMQQLDALEEGSLDTLVATCSFYDRSLHLWNPKTKAKCDGKL